jgi:hypothetical protein
MLDRLACVCEGCDGRLSDEQWRLSFEREEQLRHAYECGCGTVTITIARDQG